MTEDETQDWSVLSPRQREAWKLHVAGSKAPQIAEKLGVSDSRAYELVATTRNKLGIPPSGRGRPWKGGKRAHRRRAKRHERSTQRELQVATATSPVVETIRDLMLEAGVATEVSQQVVDRLADLDLAGSRVTTKLRDASVKDLTKLVGDRALRIIESVDDDAIADAKLRDRMVSFGILVDKHQLLSGQPTQRMDITDRRKMDEVVKLFMAEARRRGLEVEGEPGREVRVLRPQRTLPQGAH